MHPILRKIRFHFKLYEAAKKKLVALNTIGVTHTVPVNTQTVILFCLRSLWRNQNF